MLSKTLSQGLQRYDIGAKLRALRLRKKLGLVELGKQTGLSPAMLSKIERGRLFPTLPTLFRIALVFGVGLDHFFADARDQPLVAVVRRRDRLRFPERADAGTRVSYHFESLDFPATARRMNAYYAEFDAVPVGEADKHRHAGAEFVYLLEGKLVITFEDGEQILGMGDSIYFEADRPHSYRRLGPSRCAAVVVTAT